jgi:hypothetical protein
MFATLSYGPIFPASTRRPARPIARPSGKSSCRRETIDNATTGYDVIVVGATSGI